MTTVFGAGYADAYDWIYTGKDYESECDLIETLLRRHAASRVRSLLDLGCGTGGHALPLGARGYRVLGVDASAAMLARARQKAVELDVSANVAFCVGDLRSFRAAEQFDAVLMMFAVLGYLTSDQDVAAGLATARAHLARGGLLLFDVWHSPAVLREGPVRRERVVKGAEHDPRGALHRVVEGTLERDAPVCRVEIELVRVIGDRRVTETRETHRMRHFDRRELDRLLAAAGFEPRLFAAFPDADRPADASTWNALGLAVAR